MMLHMAQAGLTVLAVAGPVERVVRPAHSGRHVLYLPDFARSNAS